jgi:Ca2+/H+ antiporter
VACLAAASKHKAENESNHSVVLRFGIFLMCLLSLLGVAKIRVAIVEKLSRQTTAGALVVRRTSVLLGEGWFTST